MKFLIRRRCLLTLKRVDEKDYRFLYGLLKERDRIVNISHRQMPSWDEHVKFNRSKPYKYDFIIKDGKRRVGRVYITSRNEIGIFIKKIFQSRGYGAAVLGMVLNKLKGRAVYANVAPSNKKSQKFFEKFGFKLIQYTYCRRKSEGP